MRADLDAYLDQHAGQPFCWRTHNCAHFAAGWVRHVRGVDLLQPWGPLMQQTRTALRRLRAEGGHLVVADKALGAHLPGQYAARGDVVLLAGWGCMAKRYTGAAWGLCTGNRIAALAPTGLVLLPLDQARVAWRV